MAARVRPGLSLEGVFFRIGSHELLQGLYLAAEPGQVCGLFGPNGSGKSTALKIAAGQLRPTSGAVFIDGQKFETPSLRRRFAHLAYMPQESMLPPQWTVAKMIDCLKGGCRGIREDALLAPLIGQEIGALSAGERRYLELQLVFQLDRRYVLLDEPFSGLAPIFIEKMSQEIVAQVKGGKGVLLTDHAYQDVVPLVDRSYLLHQKTALPLSGGSDCQAELKTYGYL